MTLAMTDALTKLLIEKGLIRDAEFKQKLLGGAYGVPAHSESENAMIIKNLRTKGQTEMLDSRFPAVPLRRAQEGCDSHSSVASSPSWFHHRCRAYTGKVIQDNEGSRSAWIGTGKRVGGQEMG
jgi:hypothetical protein